MPDTLDDYQTFVLSKKPKPILAGFKTDSARSNSHLFPFQQDIVTWACELGRAAIFADTGLGKTRMQLVWADLVAKHSNGNVLILCPLAVATQTISEGQEIGINVNYCRSQDEVVDGITITNYEMLEKFDVDFFQGVVLDESSRIKSYQSKSRELIINLFKDTQYRLACTATPAPNDYMELGNHSEFVGAMQRDVMLAMFFTHDGGEAAKWRLKHHAQADFWLWLSTWAAAVRKPSDLGYDDTGYELPALTTYEHIVESNSPDGMLFYEARSLTEQRHARRDSLEARIAKAVEIVSNEPNEPWVVWCELNDESAALSEVLADAVEVKGSDTIKHKESSMLSFTKGDIRVLVTKPSICGFGMNWQHCANTLFVGVSHSYESFYQAIRRFYRFGQTRSVNVHMVYSEAEAAIMRNLQRKEQDAKFMADAMIDHIRKTQQLGKVANMRKIAKHNPELVMSIPEWLRSEQ